MNPVDDFGCGRYRIRYPQQVLAGQGHDVQLVVDRIDPADRVVVVFQRPLMKQIATDTIPHFQSLGYACVVEVDDHLSKIHPHHVSWQAHQPQFHPEANFQWLEECCWQADLVIGSTKELVDWYAPHGRGVMIPNFLPERFIAGRPEPEGEPKRLGWAGQTHTHPGDLDVARRAVRQVSGLPGWTFRTIGFAQTLVDVGVAGEVVPWVPIDDYPKALRSFDLGIVPLQLHAFNQAKSALKGLEYAGAGVPFVASPTEPYRALHALGAGVLAESRGDWCAALRRLARDADLRQEMALAGLEVARTQTYERNAWRWLEAFEMARANFEGRPLSEWARAAQFKVRGKTAADALVM